MQLYQRARAADAAKQREYERAAALLCAEDMVFVDEVGMVCPQPAGGRSLGASLACLFAEPAHQRRLPPLQDNTSHQRTRGYALVGERTSEKMWWVRRRRITAFVVMDHTGVLDWWIQDGGMGSADLCSAAAEVLVRPGGGGRG